MRHDLLVYLAGPLTAKGDHTVADHVKAATTTYFYLIDAHIPAFCPHLGALAPEAFLIDYEKWLLYDFTIIDRSTHMLMLPGWEESSGAIREHEYARSRSLPIALSLIALLKMLGRAA